MKQAFLIALCSFFFLTNCSLSDDNNQNNTTYKTYWHLVNTTGGVAGVDDDFDLEEIVWFFDEENMILTVENNNSDTTKEDALESGTYDYSITNDDTNYFLFIDSTEFGSYTISSSEFVIDQNITTTGTLDDGFQYTFKRVLVAQN